MVTEQWVADEVLKVVPSADVSVTDLHKSGDHFHVRVISSDYEGRRPLQRQKPLLNHFKQFIEQNIVHALDLKCMTPEQASKSGNTAFDPHGNDVEFFGVHIRREKKE
jgi:acid stress-induced BolA-like protein IbaG/YrbA